MSEHHATKLVNEAVNYIKKELKTMPEVGIILGSGLGVLADSIENGIVIPYHDIPGFPTSTVAGHAGQFVLGQLAGKEVLLMNGRFHLYEGYDVSIVATPLRMMKQLGIHTVIVTNASGGINKEFEAGDLMIIEDHINMMFRNPLIGPNDEQFGVRFPDMSDAYDTTLRQLAKQVATDLGIDIREGVYAGVLGPMYETPAEIRMLRILGGDAVGMSTVPEVIAAKHAGLNVLGISCISNMAAGILPEPLSHEEVIATTTLVKDQFIRLILGVLRKL